MIELDVDGLLGRFVTEAEQVGVVIREPQLRPLHGGASSLTFVATGRAVDETPCSLVLKVAPPGLPPVKNRDVLRQARLLRALGTTSTVRVPLVLLEVEGRSLDQPPFFAMSFVEGECLEPVGDPLPQGTQLPDSAELTARMLDCARQLGALHALDPAALSLAEEPVSRGADEVARWSRIISSVDADLVQGWEPVAEELAATVPDAMGPAVVHGDYPAR